MVISHGVLAERLRREPTPAQDDPAIAVPVPGRRTLVQASERGALNVERAAVPVPGRRTWVQAIDWDALDAERATAAPVQRREAGGDAPAASIVHAAAARGIATGGSALPYASTIQRLFGRHDISAIQAHVGDDAAAAAGAMGARGFATGHHVVFAGAPDLFTAAHEAAHVIQQRGGVQLAGGVGEVGDRYEQHANEVAEQIVRGESAEALLDRVAGAGATAAPTGAVQHMLKRARQGESPGERIDRLTAEVAPARVRAVVAALVGHLSVPSDADVRTAYPAAVAAHVHGKVAGAAQAVALALHPRIAAQTGPLVGLLNDAKIASAAELLGLLHSAKLASLAELVTALAEANILSGADLTVLLASPKVAQAATLIALVRRPICPDSTALIAFFADPHIPSLLEVEREVAAGAIAAWGDWAARRNVTDRPIGGPPPDLAALRAMTVAQLYQHGQDHAAWHAGIAQAADRDQIRALLDFLRNTDGALAGCGTFNAGALYDAVAAGGGFAGARGAELRAYARAVDGQTTCPSDPENRIADALARGRDVVVLEAALAPDLLHHLFTARWLDRLCDSGHLAEFVAYVGTGTPTLSAREGKEIRAYLALRDEGVDPRTVQTVLATWVANPHRFHERVLTALVTAVTAGNPGGHPVTVLVHSAQDRDGAFHRDANLAGVVTRPGHHTLMLEGQGDLATVSGKLTTIATAAPGGKIANVMLVGHGQSQSIDITGTTDARGRETPNGVDIGRSAGRAFLRDLIDKMASGPQAHLVLAACHTDSNAVEDTRDLGTTARWQDDAQKIRDHIRDNPSLATFARSYAAGKVTPQQLAVHGANGATRDGMEFLDSTGALTMVAPRDPQIGGTKLAYVEHGQDPKGVMRAVLEEWATTDRGAALMQAMVRRMAVRDTDFRKQVIRTLFDLIANQYWDSATNIARMVEVAGAVKKLRYPEDCTVSKLGSAGLAGLELTALDRDLRRTQDWTSEPYLSIVFDQALNRHAQVVATLSAMRVAIRDLIRGDRHYIAASFPFAAQLPVTSVASASAGQVTLAIIGLKQHNNADARTFLQAYVSQVPPPVVPAHLGNLGSLQRDLGPVAGPTAKNANLAIDGQPNRTLHVAPLTKTGTATCDTSAHQAPDVTSAGIAVAANTPVSVIGRLPGWYAVEHGQLTKYVPNADVNVP